MKWLWNSVNNTKSEVDKEYQIKQLWKAINTEHTWITLVRRNKINMKPVYNIFQLLAHNMIQLMINNGINQLPHKSRIHNNVHIGRWEIICYAFTLFMFCTPIPLPNMKWRLASLLQGMISWQILDCWKLWLPLIRLHMFIITCSKIKAFNVTGIVYLNMEAWNRFSAGLGKDETVVEVHDNDSSQTSGSMIFDEDSHCM
jgi:hypothetical protein